MKKLLNVIFGLTILLSLAGNVFSGEKTSTGFYWPTGSSSIGSSGPWLGSGCPDGDGKYFNGLYHTGRDMMASLNDPVYAIAEGEVAYISNSPQSGWGDGNAGIFIRHKKSDGKYFWALYGHIVTSVTVGQHISAGQEIGKIGFWSDGNHLHFGIYPNNSVPPAPFGRMPCSSWPSTNGFVDPVNWITTYSPYVNVVGYYSNGFHNDGTSQAFVNSFNRLSPKIGWPSDNGGSVFVHEWVSSHDSRYKTYVQDYQGDDQSMLILNVLSTPYQANWVKGGFCYLYRISDGPFAFGIAYTEEITHNYATSPISTAIDPIQPGDCVTVQKFQQVYYIGTTPNAGQRQTMVWKTGINAQHFPIGEYAIYPESCSGVCPQAGDQIYIMDNSHTSDASYDKPWPKSGIKVPTGIWFTKPGTYQFVLHNTNGTRKSGWGLTVQITEGNHQFSGNSNTIDTTITVATPSNLSTSAISQSRIDLSWTGNNGANPVEYRVYRKLSGSSGETTYIGSTTSNTFSDTYLNSGTSYCYQISAAYGGLESSKSDLVCATTLNEPNLVLPVVNFSLDRTVVYPGSLIFFTDKSSGTDANSTWYWEFGDGYTSTTQNPSHRYNSAGHYDVSLTVSNSYGNRSLIKRSCLNVLYGSPGITWSSTDIGHATTNGYVSYDSTTNRFVIESTGSGVNETNTQFTYLYQAHSDCANVSTHLLSHTLADPKAMAGIMIMETPDANSNYVMIAATQSQGIILQYRQNGTITKIGSEYYDYPVYLRLTRNGNKFTAQYSFTGNTSEWLTIATANLEFATSYQVGLFATPGNSSSVSTAIFENLNVSSNPPKVGGLRIK